MWQDHSLFFTESKYLHSDADTAQVKVKREIPFLRIVSGASFVVFYHLCFVKSNWLWYDLNDGFWNMMIS